MSQWTVVQYLQPPDHGDWILHSKCKQEECASVEDMLPLGPTCIQYDNHYDDIFPDHVVCTAERGSRDTGDRPIVTLQATRQHPI